MTKIEAVEFDISSTGRYNFEQSNLCLLNSSEYCIHAVAYGTLTLCNHHSPSSRETLLCTIVIDSITKLHHRINIQLEEEVPVLD